LRAKEEFGQAAIPQKPISCHLCLLFLRDSRRAHVREEAGRIVIEPIRRKEYDLAELLRGISSRNLHDEIDFSGPAGKANYENSRQRFHQARG